jgi:hypothetical protein
LKDQIGENSPRGRQVSQCWEGVGEQMQKKDLEGKAYASYSTTIRTWEETRSYHDGRA